MKRCLITLGNNKFTKQAVHVLYLAEQEAVHFQHHYIGIEHLLLGLLHENDCVAAKVLRHLSVELKELRSAIEETIDYGDCS